MFLSKCSSRSSQSSLGSAEPLSPLKRRKKVERLFLKIEDEGSMYFPFLLNHESAWNSVTMSVVAEKISATVIVGIDEAGRGALAGPVVAAACVLPRLDHFPVKVGDSKQMTSSQRELASRWLIKSCIHGIGFVEAHEIDRIGILAANELAMQLAVEQIAAIHPHLYLLVDGRDAFWFDHPHSSIIGGDAIEPCIGAASIIAKVARDKRMSGLRRKYPRFAFEKHKGYGTPEHFEELKKHGACEVHRRSFLRNL